MTNNNQDELKAHLFQSLRNIEHRAKSRQHAIPALIGAKKDWQGIAYTLGGVRVLSMMNEISELMPCPERITSVPGSKEWVLGLANVRGELLPIIDLQQFVGAGPVILGGQARVMVIRSLGVSTGLLVGSVQGMRYFSKDQRIPDAIFEGALGKYVYDVFGLEDGVWPVFSMAALVDDAGFMQVEG